MSCIMGNMLTISGKKKKVNMFTKYTLQKIMNRDIGRNRMGIEDYQEELSILDDMHQIYSMLHTISNRIQTEADANLEDITSRQLMLLIAIRHLEPGQATIVNIAAMLGTSKQNVTRLVSAMVHNGFLDSIQGETDKRNVNIRITDKGLEAMQKNTIRSNNYFADLFRDFSRDELKLLRKMLTRLNHSEDGKKDFSEKADINIGKNTKEMEHFLQQIRERLL